jgi:hypothetical protein
MRGGGYGLYCDGSCQKGMLTVLSTTARGHEQLISNGERFKPAFAERDKKQTMINLRGIPTNWFKNQLCPSTRIFGYGSELVVDSICTRPFVFLTGFGLNFASF